MKVSLKVADQTNRYTPTDEQAEAIRLFQTGDDLAIEAGAGTGKTISLKLLAESTAKSGQYTAFNKAVVTEAETLLPASCKANTAHSLAYAVVGIKYKGRMTTERMSPRQLATKLKIPGMSIHTPFSSYSKVLEGWRLAGHVKNAVDKFCQSADRKITTKHFTYLEGIDAEGEYDNNNRIAEQMLPAAEALWKDLQGLTGFAAFSYQHYLKIWELSNPKINADYLLVDEAQDLSPVMLSIIKQQSCQKVLVGDRAQALYGFTGAIDALSQIKVDHWTQLSKSYRFGQVIADEANRLLRMLPGCTLQLTGNGKVSTIGRVPFPRAVLSRTNAAAVEGVLLNGGHLIGGGKDVISFVDAAEKLRNGQKVSHPELTCFDTWSELEAYVAEDVGSDLKLLVSLVKKFGGAKIAQALRTMPSASQAKTIYSTVHKVKGLGFESVKMSDDFALVGNKCECGHTVKAHNGRCFKCADCRSYTRKPPTDNDIRLLYVGFTRAKERLDKGLVTV